MPTSNFYIGEADGWVEVADAPNELRISGYPHTHPYLLYAGPSAPSLIGAASTGSVIFTGLPTAAQTVTIGSEVYTFRAAATLAFEVTIGADATETGDNLEATILADSTLVTASNAAGTVTLTSVLPGVQGNYALSETASNTTVSGAAMTGGVDAIDGIIMCHHPFETHNQMTDKMYARIVNPVPTSKRFDGKLRLDVFTIDGV